MKRERVSVLGAVILAAAVGLLSSCASTADVLVNKDPGSFYGTAFAATQAEAETKAYTDLAFNVLSETGSLRPGTKKTAFVMTSEIEAAFGELKLKPDKVEKKSETRYDVIYRLQKTRWEKAEAARLAKLNKEYGESFAAIKGNSASAAAKIKAAAPILASIERSGAFNRIVGLEASGPILNSQIESYCTELVKGLSFSAKPESGLIRADVPVVVTASKAGAALADLPVAAVWKIDAKTASAPELLTSDASGAVSAKLPADSKFSDKKLVLALNTNFASYDKTVAFLAKLDGQTAVSYNYRSTAAAAAQTEKPVVFGAGEYQIGSVAQDRRAGSIEKNRTVKVDAFAMAAKLVTNAEYKIYLDAINASPADYPDYWDNPDFNKPEQPVIGITLKEAEAYAAWLSGVRGVKYRLPTEAEYEIAARAGQNVTYPWGDQLPSSGNYAAFSGSAKATQPVASYENGKNAAGMFDMSGNVWEWTTSLPEGSMSGNATYCIVKGGSYMDSQYELRISNRVLRNPEERFPDVGFRLVSEVAK